MSNPESAPRHLPHDEPATPASLFGGRQAARIRAIVHADLLPEERATADAMVMTAWLTPAQRAVYAPSLRSGPVPEEFLQRLADERRVVLEEGTDPVGDEAESAKAAERAANQLLLRLFEGALLVVAAVCAVIAVVQAWRSEADTLLDRVPEQAPVLLVTMLVCTMVAAVIGAVATRRRDRSLLDWAVSRPGQLGRGLPLRRPLQGGSAGPAVVGSLGPAVLVGAGVLAIVGGAAILLLALAMDQQGEAVAAAPWLLGGGALAIVLAVLIVYLRSRLALRRARRARAAQWIGPRPPAQEPPTL